MLNVVVPLLSVAAEAVRVQVPATVEEKLPKTTWPEALVVAVVLPLSFPEEKRRRTTTPARATALPNESTTCTTGRKALPAVTGVPGGVAIERPAAAAGVTWSVFDETGLSSATDATS